MHSEKTVAIIPAAGVGQRFGVGPSKQFRLLAGKPVLAYPIEIFEKSLPVDEITLVVPEGSIAYCREEIVAKYDFQKVKRIIPGGSKRFYSVERGLNSIPEDTDIVVVHDGVRPFVTKEMIERVIVEASSTGGAICAIRLKDTVKKSTSPSGTYIETTVPRSSLWLAHTPQAFRYEILRNAFDKSKTEGFIGTDEASLVERLGVKVKLIEGSELNIKITTQEDFLLAEWILEKKLTES